MSATIVHTEADWLECMKKHNHRSEKCKLVKPPAPEVPCTPTDIRAKCVRQRDVDRGYVPVVTVGQLRGKDAPCVKNDTRKACAAAQDRLLHPNKHRQPLPSPFDKATPQNQRSFCKVMFAAREFSSQPMHFLSKTPKIYTALDRYSETCLNVMANVSVFGPSHPIQTPLDTETSVTHKHGYIPMALGMILGGGFGLFGSNDPEVGTAASLAMAGASVAELAWHSFQCGSVKDLDCIIQGVKLDIMRPFLGDDAYAFTARMPSGVTFALLSTTLSTAYGAVTGGVAEILNARRELATFGGSWIAYNVARAVFSERGNVLGDAVEGMLQDVERLATMLLPKGITKSFGEDQQGRDALSFATVAVATIVGLTLYKFEQNQPIFTLNSLLGMGLTALLVPSGMTFIHEWSRTSSMNRAGETVVKDLGKQFIRTIGGIFSLLFCSITPGFLKKLLGVCGEGDDDEKDGDEVPTYITDEEVRRRYGWTKWELDLIEQAFGTQARRLAVKGEFGQKVSRAAVIGQGGMPAPVDPSAREKLEL